MTSFFPFLLVFAFFPLLPSPCFFSRGACPLPRFLTYHVLSPPREESQFHFLPQRFSPLETFFSPPDMPSHPLKNESHSVLVFHSSFCPPVAPSYWPLPLPSRSFLHCLARLCSFSGCVATASTSFHLLLRGLDTIFVFPPEFSSFHSCIYLAPPYQGRTMLSSMALGISAFMTTWWPDPPPPWLFFFFW